MKETRRRSTALICQRFQSYDSFSSSRLFPNIGLRPIRSITAPDVLAALRRIEARGKIETAHRTKQRASQVFRYAIATGRAVRDPTADLRGALTPLKVTNRAALTDPKRVGELLRAIDGYSAQYSTEYALKLAPPISENTLGAALRRLGFSKDEMTAHGFRAMASTLLNEQGFPSDVIELQLADAERNEVRADYLDGLRASSNVIPIKCKAR